MNPKKCNFFEEIELFEKSNLHIVTEIGVKIDLIERNQDNPRIINSKKYILLQKFSVSYYKKFIKNLYIFVKLLLMTIINI